MKSWSRRHTLIAGMALILLTNAVALLGVAQNRSGEPESSLKLSQRELHLPYWGRRENSGIALDLAWRVAVPESRDAAGWSYVDAGGTAEWLDQAEMASLGFDVAATPERDRQRSKEVLLVLELDGPAYRQSAERARRHAAEEEAKLAAFPNDEASKRRAKQAQDWLKREESESSRLFAIDAGLDPIALRAKYPDRSRYAIVRGQVRLWRNRIENAESVRGYISRVSIDAINVPFEFRAPFDRRGHQARNAPAAAPDGTWHQTVVRGTQSPPFEATVAFGQRLEPWIIGVSVAPD